MPRRNTRLSKDGTDFHIYNRGLNRMIVFVDDLDRRAFESMLKRRLSPSDSSKGKKFVGLIELIALTPLDNHFHMILRELVPGSLEPFMQSLMTSYVRYFNKRHGRSGKLFAGEYRRVPILDETALKWELAYVLDNHPTEGTAYRFSSHRFMVGEENPDWINWQAALDAFGGLDDYLVYLQRRNERKLLNHEFGFDR